MDKVTLSIPRIHTISRRKPAPAEPGHEHHTQIDGVGTGSEDFPLGTPEQIVNRALKRAAREERRARRRLKRAGKNPKSGTTEVTTTDDKTTPFMGGLVVPKPAQVVPAGQTRDSYTAGQLLLKSADGLQELMMARQFDGFHAKLFGDMEIDIVYGVANLPAKKQPAAKSLARQFYKLSDSWKLSIADLTTRLAKKNPHAPLMAVIMKAAELLEKELAQMIYVLRIYTESIKQIREGRFTRELSATEIFFEDAFQLYFTGDLHCSEEGKAPAVQLPASTYRVGAVFMARVTSSGLATVPGARGPIGANALQLPYEMLDIIMIMLDLIGHEARHNVFHDLIGLEDEMLDVVEQALRQAHKTGALKFKNEEMMLGKQKMATIDLVVKLMRDWLGEIDADFVGGVLFSGPSFGDSMAISFPAMMVRDGKVSQKVKLLRTDSRFDLVPQPDGTTGLIFEEHPVDYIRIYFVAAALAEIGFHKKAAELRQLADFAVGDELPKEIIYTDAEGKSDLVIRFDTADLLAVAAIMAKAIIRTPLKAQLGKSCGDLVMWNDKRQTKVDILTDLLAQGISILPTNIGSIFATYVGAAACQAYIKLVSQGKMAPAAAAKQVNDAALKMIGGLRSLSNSQCAEANPPVAV